jgi:hypothetical protein
MLALATCSTACTSLNVLGHCELPEALTTTDDVVELPVKLSEQEAYKAWARDRAQLRKTIRHHADTVAFVREHCQ